MGNWLTQILGKDSSSVAGVEDTHFALRTTSRPMDLGARGAYSLAKTSGTMAAALGADSEIFQFRWTDSTKKCLLRSLSINGGSIVGFTAGFGKFEAYHARLWTADGTGGTAIVLSTNQTNNKRTDFAKPLLSDTGVRIASTAALGAGTKATDVNPFAGCAFGLANVAGAGLGYGTPLWQCVTPGEYPVLYEQNEGFTIKTTVPATGTWTFTVTVVWDEIDPTEVEGWT